MTNNREFLTFELPPALPALSDNKPLSDTEASACSLVHGTSSPYLLVAEYLLASRADNRRLCTRAVARIIKKWTAEIGLDARQLSEHSLRAGFATSAPLNGFDAMLIARQTGHRSQQMLATYVRPAQWF